MIQIIQQAADDGVTISLGLAGGVIVVGEPMAVNRWLPQIRQHKPEILEALSKPKRTGHDCNISTSRAVVPYRLHDPGSTGGTLIDPDGLRSALSCLIDKYGDRLDLENLVEWVEERAAIMEFDGCMNRAEATLAALERVRELIKRKGSH